ncbi:PEP-CTERM sorting domain-containing protein [Brumicola blandensis]|uniref:PEP-CTERM sorting domain-containing protein n=1 Tax=Brumicola blandensis TaxID=3075611 RepID=A0AAW8R578_9ALTE|nr:PEP-CTERM sorting domain-containing protein [Alteromonas sp. W409]MDT0583296.1 PEP-CTERM sorting domain-containing protein [Alteromonas sp. W409]
MKNFAKTSIALALLSTVSLHSKAELITYSVTATSETKSYFLGVSDGPVTETNQAGQTTASASTSVGSFIPGDSDELSQGMQSILPVDARSDAIAGGDNGFVLSSVGFGDYYTEANVTQTYTIETGNTGNSFLFDFLIDQGSLSAFCSPLEEVVLVEQEGPFDNAGCITQNDASASAEYQIDITFGGMSIFSSFARFETLGQNNFQQLVPNQLTKTGVSLSDDDASDGLYSWSELSVEDFNLGFIGANETVELVYSATVKSEGFFGFSPDGPSLTLANSAARFGDPSNIRGISNVRAVVEASAPGSILFLGIGALALAFRRKRG